MKAFEPSRTTVVRRPRDNAGHVQLGSAATAALFPSRAMRQQAMAIREAGRQVQSTTRFAQHATQAAAVAVTATPVIAEETTTMKN